MMKTTIKILMFLITNFVFAQYPILETISFTNPSDYGKVGDNGVYAVDTNNELNQYEGLWQYDQNGLFLQLKIEKQIQRLRLPLQNVTTNYSYKDVVTIKYKLVKNGIVLHDNLSETNLNNIYSTGTKRITDNFLAGRFLEYSRNVNSHYTITRLGTTPETINFNLSRHMVALNNPRYFYNDGEPMFNIPSMGLILTKIQ